MNHNITLNADDTAIQVITLTGRFVSVLEASGEFEIKVPDMTGFVVDIADDIDLTENFDAGVQIQLVNRCGVENQIKLADSPVPISRKKSLSLDVDALPVALAENSEIAVTNLDELPAPVVNVDAPVVNVPAPVVNVDAPVVNVPAPVVNVDAPVVNVPAPVVNRYVYETVKFSMAGNSERLIDHVGAVHVHVKADSNYVNLGDFRLPYKRPYELNNVDESQEILLRNRSGGVSKVSLVVWRIASPSVVVLPVLEFVVGTANDVIPSNTVGHGYYDNTSVSVTDNDDGTIPSIVLSLFDSDGNAVYSLDAANFSGTYTVKYNAVDNHGNSAVELVRVVTFISHYISVSSNRITPLDGLYVFRGTAGEYGVNSNVDEGYEVHITIANDIEVVAVLVQDDGHFGWSLGKDVTNYPVNFDVTYKLLKDGVIVLSKTYGYSKYE